MTSYDKTDGIFLLEKSQNVTKHPCHLICKTFCQWQLTMLYKMFFFSNLGYFQVRQNDTMIPLIKNTAAKIQLKPKALPI